MQSLKKEVTSLHKLNKKMTEQDNERLELNEELKNKLIAKENVITDLKGVLNNLNLLIDELREEGARQHTKIPLKKQTNEKNK